MERKEKIQDIAMVVAGYIVAFIVAVVLLSFHAEEAKSAVTQVEASQSEAEELAEILGCIPMELLKAPLEKKGTENEAGILSWQDEEGSLFACTINENRQAFGLLTADGDKISITDTTLSDGTVHRVVQLNGEIQ